MAISETANLLVKISADTAGAKAGIGALKGQLDGFGSTVMRVGAALAGAFALREVIRSTQQWGDQLDSLNDALGLSGDEAAKWAYQARIVGISADDLGTATEGLTRRITSQTEAILQGT